MPADPSPRFTVETLDASLRFEIPSRRDWFSFLFLVIGVLGGLVILFVFAAAVIAPFVVWFFDPTLDQASRRFVAFVGGCIGLWYLVAIVFWARVLISFLWELAGRELIEITSRAVTIQRQVWGLRQNWHFEAQRIGDLKYLPPRKSLLFGEVAWFPFRVLSPGSLRFRYGKRLIRLAGDIDEAEAKQILNLIWERFPHYRNP